MSPTQKRSFSGCLRLSISILLGCLIFLGFLFFSFVFVDSLMVTVQASRLSQRGVQTQATIVDVEAIECGKNHTAGYSYTVRFSDQVGQFHSGTLECESIPNLSRGDSITIVYLPDDPTLIALPNEVGSLLLGGVAIAILVGLIDLAFLVGFILWIEKLTGKSIIASMMKRRKSAASRPEQVIFALPTGHVTGEKRTHEQPGTLPTPEFEAFHVPQTTQASLFEAQNEQDEQPSA